jgi:MOSC domain-containing protein YiiM
MMDVLAVCTSLPQPTTVKSGLTGLFKTPVEGAVAVGRLGLEGDHICDLDNHGGVDQAVYLLGDRDQAYWADFYGKTLDAGFFGENLLLSNLVSADLCIGDVLTIGDTVLQITSTRIPCVTYQAHIGQKTAMKDFMRAAKAGAYARVLVEGTVSAGQSVTLAPYAGERLSVADQMWHYVDGHKDHAYLRRLLTTPAHHKAIENARARLAT